jgi:hypothetical protein
MGFRSDMLIVGYKSGEGVVVNGEESPVDIA